ncbi:oxidoreductase [Legionella beliardensis]|uniref:Oxidoreductase n=1 Tax=Legionella beliardensis TaxID=91822 RepID=A0A378I2A5_9GAMM|nr:Gfo/Idh/MocA family oxidoreductase [Legionella beliardensis]STX29327.1 oxidoreductase [Legionella beliardensis]
MYMIKIGIIGYGYWGRKLAAEFSKLHNIDLVYICDLISENLKDAHHCYNNAKLTNNYQILLDDNQIDAVIIATPIHTHYRLTLAALDSGKHVLVEKPLVTNLNEALEIQELAQKKNKIVMVDYTPVYSSAAQMLFYLLEQDELGSIVYLNFNRTNFGSNDLKSSVIWDLAVHDIALISYLLPARLYAVSAISSGYFDKNIATIAHINLFFEGDITAYIYVSNITTEKLRHVTIAGNRKVAVFNDCLTQDKIKLYNVGIDDINDKTKYMTIKMNVLNTAQSLPVGHNDGLTMMANHFVECIEQNKLPRTNSQNSLKLIYILELIEKSIKSCGEKILVNQHI